MKGQLTEILNQGSGKIADGYYASPLKYEPGWVVIRRKPGPRNPAGCRKKWVMPENQAKGVRAFKAMNEAARAAYRDPEQRARLAAEYAAWLKEEKKRGRSGGKMNGKHVRHLWDYTRIRYSSGSCRDDVICENPSGTD